MNIQYYGGTFCYQDGQNNIENLQTLGPNGIPCMFKGFTIFDQLYCPLLWNILSLDGFFGILYKINFHVASL